MFGSMRGMAGTFLRPCPRPACRRFFLLFPDPWPKTRHHKRRFLQMETLDLLAQGAEAGGGTSLRHRRQILSALCPGTADGPSCLRMDRRTGQKDWKTRPDGWPPTRYEAKAIKGPPTYLRFRPWRLKSDHGRRCKRTKSNKWTRSAASGRRMAATWLMLVTAVILVAAIMTIALCRPRCREATEFHGLLARSFRSAAAAPAPSQKLNLAPGGGNHPVPPVQAHPAKSRAPSSKSTRTS